MARLANLPLEILRLITASLESTALKAFSLVSRRCRAAIEHDIFKTIKIRFSRKSLNTLEEISRSPLAIYVKNIHYDASELLDPLIQHWDYFTSCIYTSQEYARDNAEFYTSLRWKSFSYKAIYRYYKALARDQWAIMEDRTDIQAMTDSLPRLLNLKTIKLSFADVDGDQLLWFSKRLFISYEKSLSSHLEATLSGMAAAQQKGLAIRSVEVEGMHSILPNLHATLTQIAEKGLMSVESFKLFDSPGLLSFLSAIPLPNLQRFEIADCWLVGVSLIKFLEAHDMKIQYVEFRRISLFYEEFRQEKSYSDSVKDFWETVSDTGNAGKIESLVIVRDL